MLAARKPSSLRRAILAMVCILGLRGPGWAENPPAAKQAAKLSANASLLLKDPALQVKLTVDFKQPKAQDIVEQLRAKTKMDLTLADNIDRERPALGSLSCRNVPAWIVMDELAKSKIIEGKWERNGDGYLLTSTLPPPAPAKPPGGSTNFVLYYLLAGIPVLAVWGILHRRRRRRRQARQAGAARELPNVPESPSSS